jgi:hypothetical protein
LWFPVTAAKRTSLVSRCRKPWLKVTHSLVPHTWLPWARQQTSPGDPRESPRQKRELCVVQSYSPQRAGCIKSQLVLKVRRADQPERSQGQDKECFPHWGSGIFLPIHKPGGILSILLGRKWLCYSHLLTIAFCQSVLVHVNS